MGSIVPRIGRGIQDLVHVKRRQVEDLPQTLPQRTRHAARDQGRGLCGVAMLQSVKTLVVDH